MTELAPREKLTLLGAEALSDAELLAIFLRTGTRGKQGSSHSGCAAADHHDIRHPESSRGNNHHSCCGQDARNLKDYTGNSVFLQDRKAIYKKPDRPVRKDSRYSSAGGSDASGSSGTSGTEAGTGSAGCHRFFR